MDESLNNLLKEVEELDKELSWRFAKTYVHIAPHWYISISKDSDEKSKRLFSIIVDLQKKIGEYDYYPKKYEIVDNKVKVTEWGKTKVVKIGKWKYWIIGNILNKTYVNYDDLLKAVEEELKKLNYSEEESRKILEIQRGLIEERKKKDSSK